MPQAKLIIDFDLLYQAFREVSDENKHMIKGEFAYSLADKYFSLLKKNNKPYEYMEISQCQIALTGLYMAAKVIGFHFAHHALKQIQEIYGQIVAIDLGESWARDQSANEKFLVEGLVLDIPRNRPDVRASFSEAIKTGTPCAALVQNKPFTSKAIAATLVAYQNDCFCKSEKQELYLIKEVVDRKFLQDLHAMIDEANSLALTFDFFEQEKPKNNRRPSFA